MGVLGQGGHADIRVYWAQSPIVAEILQVPRRDIDGGRNPLADHVRTDSDACPLADSVGHAAHFDKLNVRIFYLKK